MSDSVQLSVGDMAPDFSLPNQNGETVTLSSLRGKKVLVYFYPKDNTSGCTKEACSLRDNFAPISDKNTVILGISADSQKSHQNFIAKHQLPFDLISDTEKVAIRSFGAWGTKKMYGKEYEGIMRYSFLIGEDGKIEKIWKKVATATHGEEVMDYI